MRVNWRFISGFSIVAMALALLSGGLAGVPLNTLLLRVVLAGFVFAGIAAALNMVSTRYFPELQLLGNMPSSETETPGKHVDIFDTDEEFSMTDFEPQHTVSAEEGVNENQDNNPAGWSSDSLQMNMNTDRINERTVSPQELDRKYEAENVARAIKTVMSRDGKG